jgi:hypothetical protein
MSDVVSLEVSPEIDQQLLPEEDRPGDSGEIAAKLNSDLLRLSMGAARPVIRAHPASLVTSGKQESFIDESYHQVAINGLIIASLTILAFCLGVIFERGGVL